MKILRKLAFSSLFLLVLLASCRPREAAVQDGCPLIALSIAPQRFFLERIAGDKVASVVLVGEGQSPHGYEPSARQLESLSKAAFWLSSGTDFEETLIPKVRSLYPALSIIDGTEGVHFRTMEAHSHDSDHHGEHSSPHSSLEKDRHTWLGREPAKIMASHLVDALSSADAENASFYRERYEALIIEIDLVFAGLATQVLPLEGSSVLVYHPAFGYFLDEFGIRQIAIEEGGKEPSPRALGRLISEARESGARAIFVQAQFPKDAARSLAESLGIAVLSLDPLAENWLENIESMAQTLLLATEEDIK